MSSSYCLVIGIGLLGILAVTTTADKRNTGKLQKVIITPHDRTIITNYSYYVKPINRYTTIAGGYAFLSRPVYHAMVHGKAYKKFNVVYRPFLVDVKENACDALSKNSAAAPYTRLVHQMVKRYVNFSHPCPYEGWITVTNATIDFSPLKLVVPKGEYRVDVVVTLNKSPNKTFTVQVFSEIGET